MNLFIALNSFETHLNGTGIDMRNESFFETGPKMRYRNDSRMPLPRLQGLLAHEIQKAYDELVKVAVESNRNRKIAVSKLIAYQIGWGKCLIRWYEAGIRNEMPEMPGEGFSKWDYSGIAQHFHQKYQYDGGHEQIEVFREVVARILEIIEVEKQAGNLDREGVWPWCTLRSLKKWPLSKWIRVNTVSAYKRAARLIKSDFRE